MQKILSVLKIILFISGTLVCYLGYAVCLLFIKLTGRPFEPFRNKAMTIWGRLSCFFLSIDLTVEGTPPEPPFFLVTNHLSYLDIVILAATTKTTFVSKGEVEHWPIIGVMAKSLGIIFIDRTRKKDVKRVNKIISEQVNGRQGVTVFPEGMTTPGDKVLPFRPSLLQHPASNELDVSYAAIHYETSERDIPAYRSVSWWGRAELHKHLFLMGQNRSIKAKISFGEERIKHTDRKELAMQLHRQVQGLFEPMHDEPVEEYEPVLLDKK